MRPEDRYLWLLLTHFLYDGLDNRKRLIILNPSADEIWKEISNYWFADICDFADVKIIPFGFEQGIEQLSNSLKD